MPKIQFFKFHNSINHFGRDPFQKYTWILGSKPGAYFRGDVVWNFYSHIGTMLTKGKQMTKIQNLKFHNSLYIFGRDLP